MSDIVKAGLKALLFSARKHDLPMPNTDTSDPYPKNIDDHVDQELEGFYIWLVQKYWDENT